MKNMEDPAKKRWNEWYKTHANDPIKYDDWLVEFCEIITKCKTAIIDLGCGTGNDTKYLLEQGKDVIPCDYCEHAVQTVQHNFPSIKGAECFDMREGLPFPDDFVELVIADLSLHYFSENDTIRILNEIKRILTKDGVLLFRVNSTKDVNHGAGEGLEIEKHFYRTDDGRQKRFFDKDDAEKFFIDWNKLVLREETMDRYQELKVLWVGGFRVKK